MRKGKMRPTALIAGLWEEKEDGGRQGSHGQEFLSTISSMHAGVIPGKI
jgi:hypothetical protein